MHLARLSRLAHRNLIEFWRLCTTWGDKGELLDTGSVMLYATGSATMPSYNGVFRLASSVPAGDVLDQADEWFLSRSLPYSVKLRDIDEDDDLRHECRRRRFVSLGDPVPEMVLCRPPIGHIAEGTEIRQVRTEDDLADFVRVCALSYGPGGISPSEVRAAFGRSAEVLGSPHVTTLLARIDGVAVGAAQAVVTGEVGGIYWVGTPAEMRGRGIGRGISQAATEAVFEQGALASTLQSSAIGESVYRRLGYEPIYRYRTYFRVPRRPAAPNRPVEGELTG